MCSPLVWKRLGLQSAGDAVFMPTYYVLATSEVLLGAQRKKVLFRSLVMFLEDTIPPLFYVL